VVARGDRLARTLVHRLLDHLVGGDLTLREGDAVHHFTGGRDDPYGRPRIQVTVEVHDPGLYRAVATRGSSGLGEAYRRGWFTTDDLPGLIRLLLRSLRTTEPLRRGVRRVTSRVTDPVRRLRGPDPDRDRRNIAAHYDLGNAFFELFLDETLTYSSALFGRPDDDLSEASVAKIDRLCRTLDLRPGMRIAEIGTGWGSFALHAAGHFGVEVVTTTLSEEQYHRARGRVAEAGLEDRIEVRLDHFRELEAEYGAGSFDAVVAVEMVEAVDWRELDDFMAHCSRLLTPRGALALQAIVTAPHRQLLTRTSTDFIKTHVFPGSSIPSVPSLLDAAARGTDLIPTDLHDFGMHYAETLRRWRAALATRWDDAALLGLDDEFLRLWDFYLAYCEAGFEERQVSVVQMVLERPGRAVSLQPGSLEPGLLEPGSLQRGTAPTG
jgi:cyclopropane-fatty-acyl-phospholipid synthase